MTDYLLPEPQITSHSLKYKIDSFESESTTSSSEYSSTQNSLDNLNNNELSQPIIQGESSTSSPIKNFFKAPQSAHPLWRFGVLVLGIFLMFSARFNVPNNDVDTLQDLVMDYFQPINDWIHANSDSLGPKLLLFCCATNMDLIFFITIFHWLKYGKTGRLIYSLIFFYLARTLVQLTSFQPYPKGYYWESPGFPSFVAPYGRSTDFFFSGHSGFLVLMQNEWGKIGNKKIQRYIQANLIYTIFVLLACQGHYSIDIFTGVFFADYVFGRVDTNKEVIDNFFVGVASFLENLYRKIAGRKIENKEE